MKFRTEYVPERSSLTLSPANPVVLVGSCFAQNVARKMRECCWEVFNEAGTLYNPVSIARVLELLVFTSDIPSALESTLFESEGYVHSWLFDSHFSRGSRQDCVDLIWSLSAGIVSALERAQALVVTFGTAWCYYLESIPDFVVANCHKMPQSLFERRRVPAGDIADVWVSLCARLRERFPGLSVIFTVSPVRHLKDGFEGNSRSKAELLLAVEDICSRARETFYFPAFEIVNDDLRDYRFYAADLAHPSEQAVEYIWEKFRATYLDAEGERMVKEGEKEFKRMNHRPIRRK